MKILKKQIMKSINNYQQNLEFPNGMTGGPVFEPEPGWGGQLSAWLKLNLRKIILGTLILAATLVLYLYSPLQKADNTSPQTDTDGKHSLTNRVRDDKKNETTTAENSPNTPKIYRQTAQRGQGVTHLARASFMKYLSEYPDGNLTPEHKIYIEDYLRKLKPKKILIVGENVEFSVEDIKNAIEKAKKLEPEELKNLSKYTKRVSGLI